jgi:hypothetical protein
MSHRYCIDCIHFHTQVVTLNEKTEIKFSNDYFVLKTLQYNGFARIYFCKKGMTNKPYLIDYKTARLQHKLRCPHFEGFEDPIPFASGFTMNEHISNPITITINTGGVVFNVPKEGDNE